MNHIKIHLEHTLCDIDRNIFGGFAEHLRQCIYGGIYDPDSPFTDEDGVRFDEEWLLGGRKVIGL